MWIMRNDAFLSLVAHNDKPGVLLARGRSEDHVMVLARWLNDRGVESEILSTPRADYAYRIEISTDLAAEFVAESVRSVDYPNFKNSVGDDLYHDALLQVWTAMYRFQFDDASR